MSDFKDFLAMTAIEDALEEYEEENHAKISASYLHARHRAKTSDHSKMSAGWGIALVSVILSNVFLLCFEWVILSAIMIPLGLFIGFMWDVIHDSRKHGDATVGYWLMLLCDVLAVGVAFLIHWWPIIPIVVVLTFFIGLGWNAMNDVEKQINSEKEEDKANRI